MSPITRKLLHFVTLFHTIALPVIVVLFLYFFLESIPLSYLIPFISLYIVARGISFFFPIAKDKKEHTETLPPTFLITMANIVILFLLATLVDRYELTEYRYLITILTLLLVNVVYIEYHTHFLVSSWQHLMRRGIIPRLLRGTLLIIASGGLYALYNTLSDTTPPPLPTQPRVTQSEVTGVISTRDPLETDPLYLGTGSTLAGTGNEDTPPPVREATGTLTTDSGVRIDSIESTDGRATARIEGGRLVVEVLAPDPVTSTGSEWIIETTLDTGRGGGGLQGVVISAPKATPRSGTYPSYQPITLTAPGASGIFFTLDGTEPTCDGKGVSSAISTERTITVTAISCFGGNRIRGPVARHEYRY